MDPILLQEELEGNLLRDWSGVNFYVDKKGSGPFLLNDTGGIQL